MAKSKVYFTKEISPAALVRIFEALDTPLDGRVAVKISTGEAGNPHYLQPSLIKDLIDQVHGTIVECNVAYAGGRHETDIHRQTIADHGYPEIAEVDIMDEDGELELPIDDGERIKVDYVGRHLENYDNMINLAHFKGHQMGGYGGALKNQSIGIASASGKAWIHTAGKTRDCAEFMASFNDPAIAERLLPDQDTFLEAMAESAKAVSDYFQRRHGRIIYINVMNNLSIDCDCSASPEAPCMADIGIAASLDPVALDQACLDMVYKSNDPGRNRFVERVEKQHGRHIIEHAEKLGLGSRSYELVSLD